MEEIFLNGILSIKSNKNNKFYLVQIISHMKNLTGMQLIKLTLQEERNLLQLLVNKKV